MASAARAPAANPFDQFDPPAGAAPVAAAPRSSYASFDQAISPQPVATPSPEAARAKLADAMRTADPWADFRTSAPAAAGAPASDPWADFRVPAPHAAAPAAATSAPNPFDRFDSPAPLTIHGAAPAAEQPSTAADVAKSGATGIERGAIGALGLLGDARDLVGNGSEYLLQRLAKAVGAAPAGAEPQSYADIAASNRRLADVMKLPGSADVTRAVEAAAGPMYQPQTLPGRLAEGVGEALPSAAVGSGGLLRRGLEAGAAGLASTGAGEATRGTSAEPFARLGAGLVGSGGAMAVGRYLLPTVDELVARAVHGVTPEQFDAAAATKAASAGQNLFLSGPEALGAATQGATRLPDVQRAVEASTSGGPTLASLYAQRPAEVTAAVNRALDRIAPASSAPSTIGPRVQAAAQDALEQVRRGINVQTRPAYQAAEAQSVPAAVAAANAADPAFQASLRRLRADDVLGPTYHGVPDDSVAVVDAVTKDMGARSTALSNSANDGFSPHLASLYGSGAADARNAARGAVPAYDEALARQEELRRTVLNPLEQGPLGRVSNAAPGGNGVVPVTRATGDALLPRDPLTGSAPEVATARAHMDRVDPGVTDALVRQHLADKLDAASVDLAGGVNQGVGPKFRNVVAGTPQQRDNLMAALGGPARAQDLSDVLDLLQAQSYRRASGSNTAMDTATRALLSEPGGAVKLGFSMLNPYAAIHHGFGDLARRHAADRNAASLADLFAAPDSVARIQAMAGAQGNPFLADVLTRDALQAPAEARAR